jgi:hypothetical protein
MPRSNKIYDIKAPLDSTHPRRNSTPSLDHPHQPVDGTKAIKQLYSQGRRYPDAKPHERSFGAAKATPQWETHSETGKYFLANEPDNSVEPWSEMPQAPCDRWAPEYLVDTPSGFLRGSRKGGPDRFGQYDRHHSLAYDHVGNPGHPLQRSQGGALEATGADCHKSPFSAAQFSQKDRQGSEGFPGQSADQHDND